ncbi:unnamed protein product [Bathycoccus prasinos]
MQGSHYDVLGLPTSACLEEIRAAYKKNILSHHPDKSSSDKFEMFQRTKEAWRTNCFQYVCRCGCTLKVNCNDLKHKDVGHKDVGEIVIFCDDCNFELTLSIKSKVFDEAKLGIPLNLTGAKIDEYKNKNACCTYYSDNRYSVVQKYAEIL